MRLFRALILLCVGLALGLAAVRAAATTTPSTVYSVGVEYCNGKGQIDQYPTIRSGWQAWTNRVQHADLNPGSIGYVVVSRRTAPSRPFYEIDHRSWSCP